MNSKEVKIRFERSLERADTLHQTHLAAVVIGLALMYLAEIVKEAFIDSRTVIK